MSDTPIGISSECREVTYQGPISNPEAVVPISKNAPSAGLVAGDAITAVNGKPVKDLNFVQWRQEWADAARAGGQLSLTVRRGGTQVDLPVSAAQRQAVEEQFPKIQSFRCENPTGELSDLLFYRESKNSGFVRIGENTWTKVTKSDGQRFKVEIFNGKASLKNEDIPPIVSKPSMVVSIPEDATGVNLVAGIHVVMPLLAVTKDYRDALVVVPIFPFTTAALLEGGLGHVHGVGEFRIFGDAAISFVGGSLGTHLSYQFKVSDDWRFGPTAGYARLWSFWGPEDSESNAAHLVFGGLEISDELKKPTSDSRRQGELVIKILYGWGSVDGRDNDVHIPALSLGYRGGHVF